MEELNNILRKLNEINDQMRRESIAYRAELREREKLGLTGDDAIRHYNNWMQKCNMEHLMVK